MATAAAARGRATKLGHVRNDRFAGLQELVTWMNALEEAERDGVPAQDIRNSTWGVVREALVLPLSRRAQRATLLKGLDSHATAGAVQDVAARLSAQHFAVVWSAIRAAADEGAWDRLRRCGQCRAWFIDTTKNRTQRWCSKKCRERLWTRPYRRLRRQQRLRGGRPWRRRGR